VLQGQRVINPYESRWFWIVLVANPAVWVLLSLSALLGLDWGEQSLLMWMWQTAAAR
jgi:hypothetical protein